ncbi:hypothetical protein [Paenibacillus wynnii]|uniref:hypothetical protein n=1 Tax=Paenibacillus wynnii TaxID=268407 RepID=UPI002792E2FE|nr:hypothetical protein [Paenibacillus wynnii]MDQ0193768.1 hypothetical protein [Paenibacillus wynnii]
MTILKDFNATLDLPYYIPCLYPPIHEQLKRMGIPSKLSLLINLNLAAIPCIYVDETGNGNNAVQTTLWASEHLGYYDAYSYLGVKLKVEEVPSFESGLALIVETLNRGDLFIASGTTYHLPYSTDYQNDNYFQSLSHPILGPRNHFLALYGIDKQEVYIYDPKPWKFMNSINIKEFESFWKGDRYVSEIDSGLTKSLLVMGQAKVEQVREPMQEEELSNLFLRVLKTVATEFLQGSIINDHYFFGKAFYVKLIEQLKGYVELDVDKKTFENFYLQCLDEMKYGKYFFRDMLIEYSDVLESIQLNIIDECLDIIKLIELSLNTLYIKISRNNTDLIVEITKFIAEIVEIESRDIGLFEKIYNALPHIALLPSERRN